MKFQSYTLLYTTDKWVLDTTLSKQYKFEFKKMPSNILLFDVMLELLWWYCYHLFQFLKLFCVTCCTYNTCGIILCKQSYEERKKRCWILTLIRSSWYNDDNFIIIWEWYIMILLSIYWFHKWFYVAHNMNVPSIFILFFFFFLFKIILIYNFRIYKIVGNCLFWYMCLTYNIRQKITNNDICWWSWNKKHCQGTGWFF